jgi:hypothetical protein
MLTFFGVCFRQSGLPALHHTNFGLSAFALWKMGYTPHSQGMNQLSSGSAQCWSNLEIGDGKVAWRLSRGGNFMLHAPMLRSDCGTDDFDKCALQARPHRMTT